MKPPCVYRNKEKGSQKDVKKKYEIVRRRGFKWRRRKKILFI